MRTPLPIHLVFAALFAWVALPLASRAWLGTLDEGTYLVMGAILGLVAVGWFACVQTFRIWWVPPRDDARTAGSPRRR